MIWRSVIVAGYVALAILVGIAYGSHGLAILSFFYFWAGAWVVFVLVWGWAARAAGRWHYERLTTRPLGHERIGSGPGEGAAEASEHRQVGVKPDAFNAAHPQERKPVPVL
jgi:hypothetical protein